MRALLSCCIFVFAFAVFGNNPLGFREYRQKVVISCATPEDAARVQLSPNGLPKDYKLAVSARWDDSAIEHLRTQEVMRKNGIRGTFFLNTVKWVLKRDPGYLKKLQQHGCSIGLHTVTHPQLPAYNVQEHFREYMQNRITLETAAQCMINSQVLPYCAWWTPYLLIPESIGWSMRAAGVISSPDVMFPSKEWKTLGYPEKSFAHSRLLIPGDRVPDRERFDRELAYALSKKAALEKHPSISMSMHSWHTPEGLVILDGIFKTLSNHPDWWYCNQSEYGAYRYEALNTSVAKQVRGSDAEFTISRVFPSELGAEVPLWFTVKQAVPKSVSAGKLHGTLLELPHDSAYKPPVEFDSADVEGKSTRFPEITLKLTHSGLSWFAEIKNSGKSPLRNLALTFRFPSNCAKETLRKDVALLEAGKSIMVRADQTHFRKELYYRYGKPYYAVQMDFLRNNMPCRLYADIEGNEESGLPVTPNAVSVIYGAPKELDLVRLSSPGTDPTELGLKPTEFTRKLAKVAPSAIYPNPDRKFWKEYSKYLAVVEFRPLKPGKTIITSTLFDARLKSELWHNGVRIKPVKPNSRIAEVNLTPGVNRFVFLAERMVTFHLGDGIEPLAEYFPVSFKH